MKRHSRQFFVMIFGFQFVLTIRVIALRYILYSDNHIESPKFYFSESRQSCTLPVKQGKTNAGHSMLVVSKEKRPPVECNTEFTPSREIDSTAKVTRKENYTLLTRKRKNT